MGGRLAERRVAVITGGAVRVGRAISRALAADGWALVVNYHGSEGVAEELVEELERVGRPARAVRADVADPAQIDKLLSVTVDTFGRLDLVVNNAAIFERRSFLDLDDELWERTLAVNLTGAFLLARRAAAMMWEAGVGRIVNICGITGARPVGEYAPYCVAKAGLDMLTRCMAEALAPRVQVNGVAPGTVLLPEGLPEEEQLRVVRRIPAGHIGAPDDVVAAVRFLASAPPYITGTIIGVDGGASIPGR